MFANDDAVAFASRLLGLRRARSASMPAELFSEPAWDILLTAFVSCASDSGLTGAEIAERCQIAPAVVSRWLAHLCKIGLCAGAPTGELDAELQLLQPARSKIADLLANASSERW